MQINQTLQTYEPLQCASFCQTDIDYLFGQEKEHINSFTTPSQTNDDSTMNEVPRLPIVREKGIDLFRKTQSEIV